MLTFRDVIFIGFGFGKEDGWLLSIFEEGLPSASLVFVNELEVGWVDDHGLVCFEFLLD